MLSDEAAKEQMAKEMADAGDMVTAHAVMNETWVFWPLVLRAMRLSYAAGAEDQRQHHAHREAALRAGATPEQQ